VNAVALPGGPKPDKAEHEDALSHRVAEISKFFGQPMLAAMGVLALVFGYIGYRSYFKSRGLPSGVADIFYADIQLVKLSSKIEGGHVPWTLNVGRLLAPAVTGFAAWRSVAALYRDRFDKVRLQNWRGHVVIGGDQEQARAVTRAMRQQRRKVVVVDSGLDEKRIASLRSLGVLSVIGDARRGDVLANARAGRATALVAMSDDDAANLESALRALPLAARNKQPLRAIAHIAGVDLCELLRIDSLNDAGNVRSIDYLNGLELAARDIEHAAEGALGHPLHAAERGLLVTGPAPLVSHLLARLARQARAEFGDGGARPAVWLVGADANAALAEAARRVHMIEQHLDIAVQAVTIESVMAGSTDNGRSWPDVSVAVIVGKGVETLGVALAITERLEHDGLTVAALPNAAPLLPLVRPARPGRAALVVVDTVRWASDVDLVLGGTVEVLARATHENYVVARHAAGGQVEGDPSLLPWGSLSEHLRESNRAQARHISVKLAAIGCTLAPLTGRREAFVPSAEEIEHLAELEHQRWTDERRAAGWRDGPRDAMKKTSPFLVPWAELPEDTRELDRITVRDLPRFLLDVGYEIVRVEQ
jgi:hypothetical protein